MVSKGQVEKLARQGRAASLSGTLMETETKNRILIRAAGNLREKKKEILAENAKDLRAAEKKKISGALLDRLTLNEKRVEEMAAGLDDVSRLPDPVGHVVASWERPNGLKVRRIRIPLGVIAIIYESRPNVTIDAAGLCLKSGNAVILRGGSEAICSNLFLGRLFRQAIDEEGGDPDLVQVVPWTDREAARLLLAMTGYVDLVIPRGGEGLMKWIGQNAKVPVIKHDKGVCHVYVDRQADLSKAMSIALNAKVQRPGVCNAMETLLVHERIAPEFLPKMAERFLKAGVELRIDAAGRALLKGIKGIKAATEKDWPAEYLDLILSVKVVKDLPAAVEHIQKYGSRHTEAIVTEDAEAAAHFLKALDSSVVLWNASTRFNDGGQLGLGAEIGISTTKMHAFGPMGLEELTTTKFIIQGNGQIRE